MAGIGVRVLRQAEETQPAEHQAADHGAVFPDAAGEDQHVEPLKPDYQPGDGLDSRCTKTSSASWARSFPSAAAPATVRMSLPTPDSP